MSRRSLILATLTLGTSLSLATGQTVKLELAIEDVMTPQDLQDTGVSSLTPAQRKALNAWLNRYTQNVIKVAGGANSQRELRTPPSSSSCKTYPNTGSKESITENADGEILILLDGSMWQVIGADTVDSALWLAVEDVIVIKAEHPVGCYTYTIINTEERGEKVQAQYLGQR